MSDINPNAILSEIGKNLIMDFIKKTKNKAGNTLRHIYEEHIHRFEDYLTKTERHVTSIRTILTRDRSTHVSKVYVSIDFKSQEHEYRDSEIVDRLKRGERLVINGTGGSGKTVFLKHLWYQMITDAQGEIPIYFELRHLNEMSDVSLETTLFHHVSNAREQCPETVFRSLCRSGAFVILLDGFDEVKASRQREIERRIFEFSERYPDVKICVTSRPDDRFLSWQSFNTYHVMPLSFEQVRQLIRIVEFQSNSKNEFLRRLDRPFYEKHKSFLSIPLLASIMLLTFDHYAEVPADLHLFYEQAFTALFYYHDSFKDSFSRERRSNLTIDKFKKVFSLFCLFTYAKETYEFNDDTLRRYMESAVTAEQIEVDIEALIFDITQAICLIQKDGLNYTFSHRSFQEYFSSYAICFVLQDRSARLMEMIFSRLDDRCLSMSYRMNRDVVQRNYLLPLIDRSGLDEKIAQSADIDILRYLRLEVECIVSKRGRLQWIAGYSITEPVPFIRLYESLRHTVGLDLPAKKSQSTVGDLYIDIIMPFIKQHQREADIVNVESIQTDRVSVILTPDDTMREGEFKLNKSVVKKIEDAKKIALRSGNIPQAFRQIFIWSGKISVEQKSTDTALDNLLK